MVIATRSNRETPLPFIPLPARSSQGEGNNSFVRLTQGGGSQTRLSPGLFTLHRLRGAENGRARNFFWKAWTRLRSEASAFAALRRDKPAGRAGRAYHGKWQIADFRFERP